MSRVAQVTFHPAAAGRGRSTRTWTYLVPDECEIGDYVLPPEEDYTLLPRIVEEDRLAQVVEFGSTYEGPIKAVLSIEPSLAQRKVDTAKALIARRLSVTCSGAFVRSTLDNLEAAVREDERQRPQGAEGRGGSKRPQDSDGSRSAEGGWEPH